ncbi:probable G-protein coupled receptor Mth-like 3 [Amphiura filiformis]|uniref:probable G-protein coupled receptor Mth-like 3 n=1 Tax=Amphiura filiformis TaxID=82378 RepID=UPI003B22231E
MVSYCRLVYDVLFMMLCYVVCVRSSGLIREDVEDEFSSEFPSFLSEFDSEFSPLHLSHDGISIQLCIFGIPLFHQHSCLDRCRGSCRNYIDTSGFCQCDEQCLVYGDCCFDYEHACLKYDSVVQPFESDGAKGDDDKCTLKPIEPRISIFFDFIDGGIQISNKDGAIVSSSELGSCEAGSTFDPFLNQCRQLTCPDNFKLINETCKINSNASSGAGTKPQEILTGFGISVATMCLFLVIVTYLTFSELRNVPGKTVLSLSITLLLAQLLFLFGANQTENKTTCEMITLVMHYSWLAVFFWMNVLSFDLGCTFGSKSIKRNSNVTSQFMKYSLYAWGVPGILVAITAFVHYVIPINGSVENVYDIRTSCWLRQGMALLVAFDIPLLCLLLMNSAFFTYTIIGIQRTRRAAKVLSEVAEYGSQLKKDLNLSIRLSVIIGLPWIFGFIIPFTKVDELLYIFIILIYLQGPVIFVSFVCNKRVLGLWREKTELHQE